MNINIVGLDLDSVLSYTEDVLYKYIEQRFGISTDWSKVDQYEFECFPGFNREMAAQLNEEIESGVVLMDIMPHKYAEYATQVLRYSGLGIYIITSRPESLKDPTKEWLKTHKIVYDKLFCVHSEEKNKLVNKFNIKAFVEDRADTLESIKKYCGVPSLGLYLVDHPWNRRCEDDSIDRVDNIMEAVHEIIRRDGNGR